MNNETTPSPSTASTSDLIATLRHRAPRAALAIAAAQTALPTVRKLRDKARERTTYTVKILSTDDVYDDLHEWVLDQLPADHQRALVAWTSNRNDGLASPEGTPRTPGRLRLRYDGSREQAITINGHRIRVQVNDGDPFAKRRKPDEIVFTATSLAAQRDMLDAIAQVAKDSATNVRKPVFRMLTQWGDWTRLDDLPDRTLDSVILADGQLDRLVADVAAFLDSEADYLRRCVPWHRGHMYEGPPGTGKTSVARAIASHFNMDVWYLPLGDIDKDCNLIAAISRIGPRSMLLLEDVDVFHAMTQRDQGERGVTLSGLLNALDGIATPHGLLTVLTTNTPDVIDDAVVRPGRVDLVEHLGNADTQQIARLLTRWYDREVNPTEVADIASNFRFAPAAVVEACKRNPNPRAALRDLCAPKATHRV